MRWPLTLPTNPATENVVFSGDDLTLKLADFGLALNLREERAVTRVGTLGALGLGTPGGGCCGKSAR